MQFDHSDQFSPSGSWQGWLLQGWPSKCCPGQYAPPLLGAGLVQDQYFFCFPTPHILSHAPPTGTGYLDNTRVLLNNNMLWICYLPITPVFYHLLDYQHEEQAHALAMSGRTDHANSGMFCSLGRVVSNNVV